MAATNPLASAIHSSYAQIANRNGIVRTRPTNTRPQEFTEEQLNNAIVTTQSLLEKRDIISRLPDNGQKIRDRLVELEAELVRRAQDAVARRRESVSMDREPLLRRISSAPGGSNVSSPSTDVESAVKSLAELAISCGINEQHSPKKDEDGWKDPLEKRWEKFAAKANSAVPVRKTGQKTLLKELSIEEARQILLDNQRVREKHLLEITCRKLADRRAASHQDAPMASSGAVSFLRYRETADNISDADDGDESDDEEEEVEDYPDEE